MLVHLTSCLESLLRKVFLSAFGTEVFPVVPVLMNILAFSFIAGEMEPIRDRAWYEGFGPTLCSHTAHYLLTEGHASLV